MMKAEKGAEKKRDEKEGGEKSMKNPRHSPFFLLAYSAAGNLW